MIIHEAVSMAKPMITLIDEGQDFEKCLPILVVLEFWSERIPRRLLRG